MIITIDGPAGAGKSTIAQRLARSLGSRYLESGALYRTLTLKALQKGFITPHLSPLPQGERVGRACLPVRQGWKEESNLVQLVKKSKIWFEYEGRKLKVFLDGRDVTSDIRDVSVTNNVSLIANNPLVRRSLIKIQRDFARKGRLVAEGRDMGSVVFPKADLKIYLDASIAVRAKRRYQEMLDKGQKVSLRKVMAEITARDLRDRTRKVAPLIQPKDAVYVDTSDLTINQVLNRLIKLAR
jgi:CMP/dCMP kinase